MSVFFFVYTGKTLLAKATAGEAKVPFFTVSGQSLVAEHRVSTRGTYFRLSQRAPIALLCFLLTFFAAGGTTTVARVSIKKKTVGSCIEVYRNSLRTLSGV